MILAVIPLVIKMKRESHLEMLLFQDALLIDFQ